MKRLFSLLILMQGFLLNAQGLFKATDPVQVKQSTLTRTWYPTKYTVYQTDVAAISSIVSSAPMEFTSEAAFNNHTILSLPQADGSMEDFAIIKVQACEQAVYDKHPEIRTFSGRSLSNPKRTFRGSITVRGFKAMIMEPDRTITMVEPYADGQKTTYIVYNNKSIPAELSKDATTEMVVGEDYEKNHHVYAQGTTTTTSERTDAELVKLKIYRFAVACTGEFGQDHGGTQETAFAAVVDYTNQISAIYERDLTLRLQLVAGSEQMAFTDPDTDPYPDNSPFALLGQNPFVVNGFIGPNNYDLAHVYTRYDGGGVLGVGQLEVVCVSASKASGVTAGYQNVYGPIFVGVIGQEVGHQLGGGHTFNYCGNGRAPGSAYEPGSGSTIMSYGGACGSDNNVQANSDLYFHAGSIQEIVNNYTLYIGSTCGSFEMDGNHKPEVTLPYQNDFFIPIQTPFELKGSATDIDSDSLSYCWEEMDLGPETPMTTPVGSCPIFRTFPPTDKTNRYFPQLSSILSNTSKTTEQLPTYDRDLKFRLSAREVRASNNGISWADVEFKATALAGPFVVAKPNVSSVIWRVGEYTKVEWDVANTFNAPVNCKKVNIRLSTDGGQTWPITLASGIANDGEHNILVPNTPTGSARIRVEAADNIFFDVSNASFKILAANQPALTAGMSENTTAICLPGSFITQVLTSSVLGFSSPVSVEIIPGNLPSGSTTSLSATTIQPGESSTLTVNMENVSVAGTFQFGVRVTAAGADTTLFTVSVTSTTNDFSTMGLTKPLDGSTNLAQSQILRWTKATDAYSYDLQVATSPSFAPGTIVASKSNTQLDTFKIPFLLEKNQTYFWRIRPNNICSPHPWTEPFFFSTLTENCATYSPNDLPINIPATTANTIESKVEITNSSMITDVNVKELRGFHGYFGDLEAKLISPAGTEVTLFKNRCNNYNGAFDLGLDDDAPNAFQCPPNNNGAVFVRPQNPLSALAGGDAQGIWTLRIRDNTAGEGGVLEALQLDICQAATVNPPFIINNNALSLPSGTNQQISADLLLAGDNDNTHDQLTFTVVTVPYNGFLATDQGGTLKAGDTFTQTDLDNGKVRYFDYGLGAGSDYFRFIVADGAGGYLGNQTFFISPLVNTGDLPADANNFRLFPNPADELVWLSLEKPASTDFTLSLYNAAGQLVRTETVSRGTSRLRIETSALPQGLYFTRVDGAGIHDIQKLILR